MLPGRRLFAAGIILFSSVLACVTCYASALGPDSRAQGLAHYIVAVMHDLNGESAEAINEYQQSIKFNGFEPAPRLKLGAYYLRMNQQAQAIAQLKAVSRISPNDPEPHYLLAVIYASEHSFDLAGLEYEFILKLASHDSAANTEVYMYLGQLYYSQEKYAQAIEQFLKVIRYDPENMSAFYLLGSIYADTGERTKAMGLFRRILQIDPENSEALNSLGYIYAEEGSHLNEALRMVRRAIEIDPDNGAFYDSLGWVFYKKGMYKEALGSLQKAQTLIEDEVLYDHMGDVYRALKEYTLAFKFWGKSLRMNGGQVPVQKKIKELEKWIDSQSPHQLN